MATPILPGSLDLATLADLQLAELYIGPVSWIGQSGDGDARKVVFERVDGAFDTFAVGDLRTSTWWRLGRPEDVVAVEGLMQSAADTAPALRLESREQEIRAEQASARARLAVA